jgi:fructose-1,6-bisphosphatase/inositol monophosphatase family enzyme
MPRAPDLARVTAVLRETIAEEVLRRFGSLAPDQITAKPTAEDPDDVVSEVDRAVEARLGCALPLLLPGSLVVGEEAAAATPSLLRALATDAPVWLIDPIDGTKNFVRGDDAFGVMLALVVAGSTRAAWIALPARNEMFVAEEGSGAYEGGERLRASAGAPPSIAQDGGRPPKPPGAGAGSGCAANVRGTVHTRFLPSALQQCVNEWNDGRFCRVDSTSSAAVEYTGLARGLKDFEVFYRLLPWDHAPGALILEEAGGAVLHADGGRYTPRSTSQPTVAASSRAVAERVRQWFPS